MIHQIPAKRAAVAAAFFFIALTAAGQERTDQVAVRLFDGRDVSSVVLIASTGEMTLFARPDGDPIDVVAPGDSVRIRPSAIGLQVRRGDLDIHQDELHARATDVGAIDVQVVDGGRRTTRRYPGTIDVRVAGDKLHVTNTVPIESYVAAVVGKEYGLNDEEGAMAMAVVARTFAVRAIADDRGDTGDGIRSQVYHGLDGISEASRAAADATRGIILTYEDRPIVAVYSASNGGYTAENSDVWSGESLPYLRARKDRFDRASSPYNDWLSRVERSKVHDALSAFLGGRVSDFSIDSRSRDGRAKAVRIEFDDTPDEIISGSEFRRIVSGRLGATTLRSTLFDVKKEGNHYIFEGSGYGHGVGLSQWGAHEMATREYNYEEILRFYYPGASVRSMDDLGFGLETPVAVAKPRPGQSNAAPDEPEFDSVRQPVTSGRIRAWTASTGSAPRATADRVRVGW